MISGPPRLTGDLDMSLQGHPDTLILGGLEKLYISGLPTTQSYFRATCHPDTLFSAHLDSEFLGLCSHIISGPPGHSLLGHPDTQFRVTRISRATQPHYFRATQPHHFCKKGTLPYLHLGQHSGSPGWVHWSPATTNLFNAIEWLD